VLCMTSDDRWLELDVHITLLSMIDAVIKWNKSNENSHPHLVITSSYTSQILH
jgi:hypothetical protein